MNRQPLMNRALIVAALALAYVGLSRFGVEVPPDVKDAVEDFALIAVPLAVAYWGRRHVTPSADPQDANGTPLVPAEAAASEPDGGAGAGSYSPEAGDETAFLPRL
ncbi:hypothetical protein DER29_0488 [Micromonospora sp. M71_S20]|uniref:hypothetical protein n=1 Tax=Micromonospora sp. M71_S20 TaxID=592872 RepID=UPI000EB2174F|nr:hypothetical protein [Micromonospora sp. M71_S20]RLK22650.1 hypothetical protein DER29_0488 [Micromonospora sp. M71_S20]